MSYNCPYCRFSFERSQAQTRLKNNIKFYYCPNPKEENERKICGKMLPLNFFNSETTTISLVGSHFVGKTHFFLALLYQLKFNKSLSKLGIQGDVLGGKKENPEVYKLLEDIANGQKIEFTTHDNVIKAVIDISIIKNNKRKQIYLSFFDNPGESFSDINDMIENLSNVFQADGIVFLIEPKQLENFNEEVLKLFSYEKKSKSTDLYSVVNNVVQLLQHVQENNNTSSTNTGKPWDVFKGLSRKINKKNIAFTISKFDQISSFFHADIPYDEKGIEELILMNGQLNVNHLNSISNEILDIIDAGDERIKTLLNSGKFNTAFFAAKAANVNVDGKVIDMKDSQGIVLPLIWLLKQQNYI